MLWSCRANTVAYDQSVFYIFSEFVLKTILSLLRSGFSELEYILFLCFVLLKEGIGNDIRVN